MGHWPFQLALDPSAETPLFVQIAHAIASEVERGRLRAGDRLPGSRQLARSLDVHRNTVIAAYEELAAEGWIEGARGRGTFVAASMPDRRPRPIAGADGERARMPQQLGYRLAPGRLHSPDPHRPDIIYLAGGVPDLRIAPAAALARAYRRAVLARGGAQLNYGDVRGHPRLRAALAEMLNAKRGLAASADDVLVTRGSQMALALVARALIAPGDVVAVEDPGYAPGWSAFEAAGARLAPVPVDGDGLRVDRLQKLVARRRIRAVYVTPHHQYPTLATLSAARRLELLELARQQRFAVIEDDYDNEYHYVGRPVLPLASIDRAGSVIYVGTLSKVLAPGLRLGYAVAPQPLLRRLAALREAIDRQGDPAIECAVAELLEDGELQRHTRRMHRVYRARRDRFAELLRAELAGVVDFELPPGGMALWCRVAADIDVDEWARAADRAGVVFWPGSGFTFGGKPIQAARFGFAPRTESELAKAVSILASVVPRVRRGVTVRGR